MRIRFPFLFLFPLLTAIPGAGAQSPAPDAGKLASGTAVVAGVCRVGPAGADEAARVLPAWGNSGRRGNVLLGFNSLLEGCSLNLVDGSGLTASKSELRAVTVTMGALGGVTFFRNAVYGFTLKSDGKSPTVPGGISPAPNLTATDCLISGDLILPNGASESSNATFERTHFVKARLGSRHGMMFGSLALRKCHFEQCEVPLSWALKAADCTFQECRFVVDSVPGDGKGGVTLRVIGPVGPDGAELARFNFTVKTVSEPAARFWSPWKEDAGGGVTTEHVIGLGPERAEACVALPAKEPAAEVAAKVEGAGYGARGIAYRLRFQDGTVEVLEKGFTRSGGPVTFENGGRIKWTDAGGNHAGWFSSDYSVLVLESARLVCEREDAGGAGEGLTEASTGEEVALGVAGSTWEFPGGAGRKWLRFETPGYCVWLDDTGRRGAGNCHPLRGGAGVFVKDWPDFQTGGTVLVWNAEAKGLTVAGEGAESGTAGTLIARREPGKLTPLSAGAPEPKADSGMKRDTESGESEQPPAPPPAEVLKARSSEITALFSRMDKPTSHGGDPVEGDASGLTATTAPAKGGFVAPLAYGQFPFFQTSAKELRTLMAARHGQWPSGVEISLSHKGAATPRSGISLQLPAALLLEGLYTGRKWDPAVCVTGGLAPDGSVRSVRGLPEKLDAALALKCGIAGVPWENAKETGDFLLLRGSAALVSLQVIGVEKLEDAMALASLERSGKIQTSVTEFAKIKAIAPAGTALSGWLASAPVVSQLEKVLAAEPRHLGAKLLLDKARGKAPAFLTAETSLNVLARESAGLRPDFDTDPLFENPIKDQKKWISALAGLKRFTTLCHPDLRPLTERMIAYGTAALDLATKPPRKQEALSAAKERMMTLMTDVQEEYNEKWNNFSSVDF